VGPEWAGDNGLSNHPAAVAAGLGGLVEAGARQYATHGYASPVLLVHVATAPNAMIQPLPALPDELWTASLGATWAACARTGDPALLAAAARCAGLIDPVTS
jgi:hypothetical protein